MKKRIRERAVELALGTIFYAAAFAFMGREVENAKSWIRIQLTVGDHAWSAIASIMKIQNRNCCRLPYKPYSCLFIRPEASVRICGISTGKKAVQG